MLPAHVFRQAWMYSACPPTNVTVFCSCCAHVCLIFMLGFNGHNTDKTLNPSYIVSTIKTHRLQSKKINLTAHLVVVHIFWYRKKCFERYKNKSLLCVYRSCFSEVKSLKNINNLTCLVHSREPNSWLKRCSVYPEGLSWLSCDSYRSRHRRLDFLV